MNKKIMILEPDTTAGELLVSTAKKLNFEVVGVTQVDVYETYSQELRSNLSKVMLTQFTDLYKLVRILLHLHQKIMFKSSKWI